VAEAVKRSTGNSKINETVRQQKAALAELIVYACPLGELADQLAGFFAESRRRCGPNAAHAYMPHCTLTGFFHDDLAHLPGYIRTLGAALQRARPRQPQPVIQVEELRLEPGFYYLALAAPWLRGVIADFAHDATTPAPADRLRLKTDLHLSLAYEFSPAQATTLASLARELVSPTAPAGWELRLYERHAGGTWLCHAKWPLDC
jgi:hypothetical protein